MMIRWPGVIKPGTVYNDIISLMDWFPTLLAAAGVPDMKEQAAKGFRPAARNSKSISMATTSCRTSKAREGGSA